LGAQLWVAVITYIRLQRDFGSAGFRFVGYMNPSHGCLEARETEVFAGT